jgi:hypothetical protein
VDLRTGLAAVHRYFVLICKMSIVVGIVMGGERKFEELKINCITINTKI